jgi:hypothetical protein
MKSKRLLIFATLLLLAGALISGYIYSHYSVSPSAASPTEKAIMEFAVSNKLTTSGRYREIPTEDKTAGRIAPSQRVRLAIGWLGLPDELQNEQVGDLIVAQLSSAKNLDLVDRTSLNAVLKEQGMSLSGLTRAQGAVRIGKLLRADWFLLGSSVEVSGTNCLVVRIVDSRTGTMRDIALQPEKDHPASLAGDLANFVRDCRERASSARPQNFIAIEDFDDMSLNNHQAAFGDQLRAHLAAALRADTNVTLLERDGVDALLQEMRLDLAGLTEEQTAHPEAEIQPAIWTVYGTYQSYENQGPEVELHLGVSRTFGVNPESVLRGQPDEPLYRQAEQAVAKVVDNAPVAAFAPSRSREIREARKTEIERCAFDDFRLQHDVMGPSSYYYAEWNEKGTQAQIRHRREEGLRASQNLLLMDPTNREARLFAASFLLDPVIHRGEEARNYLEAIMDGGINDRLTACAVADLAQTYVAKDVDHARQILSAGRERFKTNAALAALLQDDLMFKEAEMNPRPQLITDDQSKEAAKQELFSQLRDGPAYPAEYVARYINSFPEAQTVGLKNYQDLLPELVVKFPDKATFAPGNGFPSVPSTCPISTWLARLSTKG